MNAISRAARSPVTRGSSGASSSDHWKVLRKSLPHIAELVLIVGAYFAYMYTRKLVFSDFEGTALENARRIVEFESTVGFFWEPTWQSWALESARALVIFFNWAYIVTFWPIILTTAAILYVINRRKYFYFRNVVMLSFVFALLIFMLFPLAPPRMLSDYFVDTIKEFGPAFYASREFADYYNAYAAMPSLHFSWTLIFGVMFLQSRHWWLKIFGIIYPTMTLFAITITGNHYIMDAVGGAVVMVSSFTAVYLLRQKVISRGRPPLQSWWRRERPRLRHVVQEVVQRVKVALAPEDLSRRKDVALAARRPDFTDPSRRQVYQGRDPMGSM